MLSLQGLSFLAKLSNEGGHIARGTLMSQLKTHAFVVHPLRTPIGRFGGGLATTRPDDLLAIVFREVIARSGIDPSRIDDGIAGCANQAGEDNRNIARMAGVLAGLPYSVPGVTVNRLCASSLEAVNIATRAIASGEGEIFLVGGVESVRREPPDGCYQGSAGCKECSERQLSHFSSS